MLWKFLEMHLKLDKLITKNINGVTMQIYMVLISYLILELMGIPEFYGHRLLDKFRYLQLELSRRSSVVHWGFDFMPGFNTSGYGVTFCLITSVTPTIWESQKSKPFGDVWLSREKWQLQPKIKP